jgi:serine/threonine protein phosphatase PrpC
MGIWDRLVRQATKSRKIQPQREQATPLKRGRGDPLEIGQATDIGKTRGANEDSFLTLKSLIAIEPEPLPVALLIIADGMGGHVKGQEASAMAIRVSSAMIVKEILLPLLSSERRVAGTRPVQEVLTEAIAAANDAIFQLEGDPGTTLTSVLVMGHSAYVAHVGDSRVYYLHQGELRQITQDHSLVERLVELGQISAAEAQEHPQRSYLYRAVGQGAELDIDTYFLRLQEDSYLLLCSDGLWSQVPEKEMVEVITESLSPQEACSRLIDQANDRGGEDNITLVVARVNY